MLGFTLAIAGAALLGTPHCIGMCGGLATAGSAGGMLPYHVGRIGVYAALGAIAGAFGLWIPGPSWVLTVLSVVLLVAMTASLVGWLPEPRLPIPIGRLARLIGNRRGPIGALGLGVLNGLLPCGLLYATLAIPVSTGDPLAGALLMALFGGLTAIPLTVAARGLRSALERRRWARPVLAGVVLLSGLGGLAWRQPSMHDDVPACHAPSEVP